MVDLGVIERVGLREVWPHEERDFSKWLADNLEKLGEALGLDLEFREREAAVGPFSLDVLAHDRDSDRPVIIENQLEATNHTHLGQLLTYAAGYDPYAVVWLTREFQDEHRQALDWLNQRTGEDTAFFGVVIEAWQIDNSRPAPHFKVVAMPNDWQKRMAIRNRSNRARPNAEKARQTQKFFDGLDIERLGEHGLSPGYTGQNRRGEVWRRFHPSASWGERVYYVPSNETIGGDEGKIWIQIFLNYPDKDRNKRLFDQLEMCKEQIEAELSEHLEWMRQNNSTPCRVRVLHDGSFDEKNPEKLSELQDWATGRLLAFHRVFTPHVEELLAH